jgi:putative tricarboxylic transport membrane protein
MTPPQGASVRSGRIGAAVLFLFAVVYGVAGSRIEYAFSSDPLGPRVFPVALAVILAVLSGLYVLKPGSSEPWPRGATLAGAVAIPVLVGLTAILLEPLGFPVVIFILTAGVGRAFGAPWAKAASAGLVHAALWYLVFGYLLEVYLPTGSLFGR